MIRASLYAYLSSQTGITNLVGQRIYPVVRPQGVSGDAICFWRTSGGHDHNLTGSSGTAIPSFSIEVLSDSYTQAEIIAEAVREAMQGFSGTMGTTQVKTVILEDEKDAYDAPQDATDAPTFIIALLYRIRYTESKPAL